MAVVFKGEQRHVFSHAMATINEQKLAKEIVENLHRDKPKNKKELLVSAGYSEVTAEANPGRVIEQKGVQQELRKYGFNEEDAKAVVVEIMNSKFEEGNVRLNAAKEVFKVVGSYAAEKTFNLTATTSVDELKNIISKDLERFRPNK